MLKLDVSCFYTLCKFAVQHIIKQYNSRHQYSAFSLHAAGKASSQDRLALCEIILAQ